MLFQGNGSLYGTHPYYWYMVTGLPAISGVLLPFFLYETIKTIASKVTIRNEYWCPKMSLVFIIISYVSFHSISSHKEFRFILPILPLVCILSSFAIGRYLILKKHDCRSASLSLASKRTRFFVMIVVLLNYPHLLFLNMIHQSAPISINRAITNHIQRLNAMNHSNGLDQEQMNHYSIHYLMGCHSTPLYSHLHVPSNDNSRHGRPTPIDAWTLDCSPSCRKNSYCESDEFISNPHDFIMKSYFHNQEDVINKEYNRQSQIEECNMNDAEQTCLVKNSKNDGIHGMRLRAIPDFLAIFENELNSHYVQNAIENEMGLFEIGRFRHCIKDIEFTRINTNAMVPHIHWSSDHILHFEVFGIALVVSFDHMILFTSRG